jgi:hypothetical protein
MNPNPMIAAVTHAKSSFDHRPRYVWWSATPTNTKMTNAALRPSQNRVQKIQSGVSPGWVGTNSTRPRKMLMPASTAHAPMMAERFVRSPLTARIAAET